jgi:predicted DNA-binding protein
MIIVSLRMLRINMIRTSLVLPPALHQQLSILAKQADKTMSEFVREQLGQVVAQEQKSQLEETYEAIWKMNGFINDPVTDASQTVDEVLYGEHGAWRGEPTKRGLWKAPHLRKAR